jgi:hypothetical protein
MIGAATPTVWSSPIVVEAVTYRFGVAVVNAPATGVVPPLLLAVPVNW